LVDDDYHHQSLDIYECAFPYGHSPSRVSNARLTIIERHHLLQFSWESVSERILKIVFLENRFFGTLCRSLIRSKLDYGCIVYGSARGSYLQMLDPVQNHALRLCLGAYRTSPSSSL